jgi:hypothetical protein
VKIGCGATIPNVCSKEEKRVKVRGPWSGLSRYMELRKSSKADGDEALNLRDRFADTWAARLREFAEDSGGGGCKCREITQSLEASDGVRPP